MRIPLPLIAAMIVGMTASLYLTLHVIPPPFIPAEPYDIVLNLSNAEWAVVGPLYGRWFIVSANVSVDVIMGEASAVAAFLPAMLSDHMTYRGFRGRYHIINKSGIYAVVANEICFRGEAVRLSNGIVVIRPSHISVEDYGTYLSVCGVVDGVGLWNGRVIVTDGSPPTMVFYLHGGGEARGSSYLNGKDEYGRWEFAQHYVANITRVDFHMGPHRNMYGRYWNGTMYYDVIDKVVWIAVKPRCPNAEVRIRVRN
jgi:hypothetical protein